MPNAVLIRELDELIEAVSNAIPANPESPQNKRLSARFARLMVDYFNDLERAFPYSKLAGIYNKYVAKESFREAGPIGEANDFLTPLLRMFRAKLLVDIIGQHVSMYMSATAEMVTWGKTKGGIPIAYEGPPIDEAIRWANRHGAQLVTKMDKETQRRLAKVIGDGIKGKRGVPGLARDIRTEFADMSKFRSQLIAKSETRMALFQSSQDNMTKMGITGKEWVLGAGGEQGNCPLCITNSSQGVIPVNKEFTNPQDTIHPGCTCAIAPARVATKEAMTPSDWKAEYKKGIPHWAEGMEPSLFAKEFVKLMKANKTVAVLEIGCGNGRDSILFAKSGHKVTSIDIVPKAIELAKGNAKKAGVDIKFEVANVEKLPFKTAAFGAVFTLSVLHSTNLKKSLSELARVLQSEGIAFVYIYGDTQFEDGRAKEDTIKFDDYLSALRGVGFKVTDSHIEQEKDYDEFGEKHRIFVVSLRKKM